MATNLATDCVLAISRLDRSRTYAQVNGWCAWQDLNLRPAAQKAHSGPEPEDARCGLTCSVAALIVADSGPASPNVCWRWLPNWPPVISLVSLMSE